MRGVKLFDAHTDELIKTFESVKECALYLGIDTAPISYNINGKLKTVAQRKYYCLPIDRIYYNDETENLSNRTPKVIDAFKEGKYIGTFDNVKLATNATGVNPNTIYKQCKGQVKKPSRGYTFTYNVERYKELKKTPVELYDAETNELYETFEDVKQCADFLGLTVTSIRANLRGLSKTVKNRSFYCKSKKYERV